MIALQINVQNIGAFAKVDKRLKGAKSALGEACYEIAKDAQKQLRTEMTRKQLIDTRNTYNSIRAIKKSDVESTTVISQEGVWLDSMSPHWIPFNKGYAINAWAIHKGHAGLKAMARAKTGYVKVVPHPFILNALSRTESRIRGIVERRVRNAMAI